MSIRQIAQLTSLSPCTVSLALHGSPRITADTRERVLSAAREIGYHPDARVKELMAHIRRKRQPDTDSCLGVFSFYDALKPWERVPHLERIYAGMERRAADLGYRLEPFWLRAPGMTARRLSEVLDARGIQGLLCFGSPELEQEMPPELDHYAIVTQGVSIKTPLHRIGSHAYNDMWRMLRKVHELGYQRPGLIVGDYEGKRSAHAYLCVYLGWWHMVMGREPQIPVLQMPGIDAGMLTPWLRDYRPDVVILAHHYNMLDRFEDYLRAQDIRAPEQLGVGVVTPILQGTRFSGLQANQRLVGEWAVDLLVSRILGSDFALPTHPRIEMVEMEWVEGRTLRPQDRP